MSSSYTIRKGLLKDRARAPPYGMNTSLFTIEMHYGGVFNWENSGVEYSGGKVRFIDFCKPCIMDDMKLIEMASNLGLESSTIKTMYYRIPGNVSRHRFVEIKTSKDAIDLGKYVDKDRIAEVYVESYINPEGNESDEGSDCEYVNDVDEEILDYFGGSDEEVGLEDDVVAIDKSNIGTDKSNIGNGNQRCFTGFEVDVDDEDILNEGCVDADALDSAVDSEEDGCADTSFRRVDMGKVQLKVGMKFETVDHLRAAITNYAIQQSKNVTYKISCCTKISLICVEGCQWKLYATKLRDEPTFRISSLYDVHSCSRTGDNRHCTSRHIANVFMDKIRNNPKWGLKEFKSEVQSTLKCKITINKANKALRIARKAIAGTNNDQFALLWDYIEEIKRSNPGTTVVMKTKDRVGPNGEPQFRSLYICWNALKRGFIDGCRPVIGLDGCHLSGPSKGVLLTAVAIDANNCMYPFAYAVVDIENTKSWKWFIQLLRSDLQMLTAEYTIISDKQKGLIKAVDEVVPGVEHRFCVRHLYNNFKIKHKGLILKDLLWKAARACTIEYFEQALGEIRVVDQEAYEWLKDKPGEHWSRSQFRTLPKCDMLLNNLCESFNSVIVDARSKPIIDMLESIREYLMEMVAKKKTAMLKAKGMFCPKIHKRLEEIKLKSHNWMPEWNGDSGFEVKGLDGSRFAVDFKKNTCGCRRWELSGIPCVHVVAACNYMSKPPEELIHVCYTREQYLKIYSNVLMPLQGRILWPKSDKAKVIPPIVAKQIGRPKRARKRDPVERQEQAEKKKKQIQKVSRKGMIVKCSKCGESGHNRQTCGIEKVPRYKKARKENQVPTVNNLLDESSSDDSEVRNQPDIVMNETQASVVNEVQAVNETVVNEGQAANENVVNEVQAVNDTVVNEGRAEPQIVVNEGQAANEIVVNEGQGTQDTIMNEREMTQETRVAEPYYVAPLVDEQLVSQNADAMKDNLYDEDIWNKLANDDVLWNIGSQNSSVGTSSNATITNEKSKSKQQVRKSSRIQNIVKKGPKQVHHVDLTQDEDAQSQQGEGSFHAGIIKAPPPPLPKGQIMRRGKMYLTIEGLKNSKLVGLKKTDFVPPRSKN